MLPSFIDNFFKIDNYKEKIEYWIKTYFKNKNFRFFEEYSNIDINQNNEEFISIFKEKYLKSFKENFYKISKISINKYVYLQNEIYRYKDVFNKKPHSHIRRIGDDKESIPDTYNKLVLGNRGYFSDFLKVDRAGEVEAIIDYIDFLKNQKIKDKNEKITKDFDESSSKDLLPIEVFENTRGYLKKNALQVNICYKNKAYDACSVLLRKIIEILIIEIYEKEDLEHKIKDSDGYYLMLKGLINSFINEKKFRKILSRNMNEILPKIKRNGDLSAHNRKYNSTKHDIDKISDDFRILFQELINTIYH